MTPRAEEGGRDGAVAAARAATDRAERAEALLAEAREEVAAGRVEVVVVAD